MAGITRLLFKIALLSLPVTLLLGVYVWFDPFKVIWHYDAYYENDKVNYINLNRNFTSTETFLNQSKTIPYNAFIFGNSRSCFYQAEHWAQKIKTPYIFHFDGWQESLLNIHHKLHFLDSRNSPIDHALLILDYSTLSGVEEQKGHLFISHPAMSELSWYQFHLEFFKTFAFSDFRNAFLDLKWSGKVKPYMKTQLIINDKPSYYQVKYNEIKNKGDDHLIATNPDSFYNARRLKIFYKRPEIPEIHKPIIGPYQKKLLQEIKGIFDKKNTNYRLVISPLYNQKKLSESDIQYLKQLFGEAFVFDFSGKNKWTEDYRNYYETSHYLPQVANAVLDSVYSLK